MIRRIAILALCGGALLCTPVPSHAQLGKLKDKIKQKIEKKSTPAAEEPEAKEESTSSKESDAAPASAGLKPGQGAWANFDFVPGERVLYFTDFSDEEVGNFPRRMEFEKGSMEVVEWPANSGKRWLRVSKDEARLKIPLPEVLPTKWTMEFDAFIPWWGMSLYATDAADSEARNYGRLHMSGSQFGYLRPHEQTEGSFLDPKNKFPGVDWDTDYSKEDGTRASDRPFRVRIHMDGKYMKVYMDEVRIVNIPNSEFARAKNLVFSFTGGSQVMLSNVSINAGGKTMYDALTSTGRLALQGIYFDTGKDIVRPESSGTLKQIADMLKAHPDLKLTIEGHTDNVGNAASNKTLSDKRAAAVKAALVGTYGIEDTRLGSVGLGDTKPAKANDTPEGRQANRRVELVVQK